jgi:xanthine dehydrogenase YagS FAD-binding subunit
MRPHSFASVRGVDAAIATVASHPSVSYIAGGTNIIDLMKDDAVAPGLLVDINALPLHRVSAGADGLRIGALARMSDVAADAGVRRDYPAISRALLLSASPQLRNMASIGGNVMQRTRCSYFRDAGVACNKRLPGTGCPAISGQNRMHAVLGGSDQCICTHASDLAVALVAFDAVVHLRGAGGERAVPLDAFYVLPGSTPARETRLEHGELITEVRVPASTVTRRSVYLKVRDRASYEFALVSVAAALDTAPDGKIRAARIALGGVAPKPWRARDAETALVGAQSGVAAFGNAAELALRGARGYWHNDFKIALAKRAIVRALRAAGSMA